MRRMLAPVLVALLLGTVTAPAGAAPATPVAAASAPQTGATASTSASSAGAATPADADPARRPAITPKTTLPEVERELMCSTCHVPLNQSDSAFANQERQAIADLIARGLTKQQVIDQMVRIYSPAVLLNPPDRTVRTLRWLLPVAGALAALLLLTVLIRRWLRRARAAELAGDGRDEDRAPGTGLSADDERRLNADLSRYA